MVVNNSDLKLLLKRSFAFLPPSLAEEAVKAVDNMKPPSSSTLSRYQMVLDASFCRRWHARWLQLFSSGKAFAIYASIDSSPQMGQDWEIMEVRIVADPVLTWRLAQLLGSLLPGDRSKAALVQWAAQLKNEELKELQSSSSQLSSQIQKHVFTPCCLGSRHSNVANKFHCLLHALKLDMGSWATVRRFLSSMEALTTDQGTERLLADVPTTWHEVEKSGFLPSMDDCLKWDRGVPWLSRPGYQAPRARGEKRSADSEAVEDEPAEPAEKKARLHESSDIVTVEDTLTDSQRPVLGASVLGASVTASAEAMPILVPSDGESEVDTEPDLPGLVDFHPDCDLDAGDLLCQACGDSEEDVCTHPSCSEPCFGCCIHCGQPLCHVHIGPMACGTVAPPHPGSRCHEHLEVPVGQASLVRTYFGLVRCPCKECLKARNNLRCPCNGTFCRGQATYMFARVLCVSDCQ